ncbi:MAG TPA: protein kinase [Kofleriaceae bacterium]|nr:protein kinase [Kofleriaceae bacterium]
MSDASERHERMTELFGRALALDAPARAALLDEVRAGDRALADELASLLAADEGAFLRTGALAPDPAAPARAIEVPGFRIERVLGEGGMGIVFAGQQLAPRREVAIKVLRARHPVVMARFTAEAEIMARLDHPGIARVYAAGDAGGAPYLVMELVAGVTLDEHVRGERPPLREKLRVFALVCDAIHHAHVKGVVHRDLKPSNVMVRDDGRVAVLDFGIARLLGDDSQRTAAGDLIGTPVYMSPEQARLRPDEVDTRSDVYTLGVILYELCAGRLPYDVRDKPLPAIARAICDDEPAPLGAIDRALRGDLDAIARRALAKAPADRYPSAAALADDVRRFLDGRSVSARSPTWIEQVARSARRHPGAAAAIAAAVLGVAAAAITITSLWLDARAARESAVASRDALELRANELTLARAQALLARDPAMALDALATLTPRGVDPWQVALIAAHAHGLGGATRVLRAHRAEVRWAERARDGAMIVTASYDGDVRAWTGDESHVGWHADGRAHVARPSPDGALIAIGGDHGQAAIVDLARGETRALAGHAHDVERLVWSPDGRWLVTADDHGGARLWWERGARGAALEGPTASVQALGACEDDRCAYGGDDHGDIYVWSLAEAPAVIAHVHAGDSAVLGAWASEDAIAAATEDGTVTTWKKIGGTFAIDRVVTIGAPIHDAAFARGGASALLGRVDGGVVRVRMDDGHALELGRLANLVRTVAIAPDGAWMAAGSDGGEVVAWNRNGRRVDLRGHTARVRHVVIDRDGLLSSDGDGVVRAWDLAAIPPSVWTGRDAPIDHVIAAGDRELAIDTGGEIRALAADGGVRLIGAAGHRVHATALLAHRLCTASGATLAEWPIDGSGERHAITLATAITALAASPDGARVAVATGGGPITIVDEGGAIVAELAGDDGGTDAVAFAPGGALLASAGEDRVVRVWRVADGRELAQLPGPKGDTHDVGFTPDGAWLIAASDDGVVRAWPVRGEAIGAPRTLAEHRGAVIALAIGAGAIVSAGRDGRIVRASPDGASRDERAIGTTPVAVALDGDVAIVADGGGALWRWAPGAAFHAVPIDATALAVTRDHHVAVGLRDGEVVRVAP